MDKEEIKGLIDFTQKRDSSDVDMLEHLEKDLKLLLRVIEDRKSMGVVDENIHKYTEEDVLRELTWVDWDGKRESSQDQLNYLGLFSDRILLQMYEIFNQTVNTHFSGEMFHKDLLKEDRNDFLRILLQKYVDGSLELSDDVVKTLFNKLKEE